MEVFTTDPAQVSKFKERLDSCFQQEVVGAYHISETTRNGWFLTPRVGPAKTLVFWGLTISCFWFEKWFSCCKYSNDSHNTTSSTSVSSSFDPRNLLKDCCYGSWKGLVSASYFLLKWTPEPPPKKKVWARRKLGQAVSGVGWWQGEVVSQNFDIVYIICIIYMVI